MAQTEEIHILIIFACQTGEVEQLALAAAVGAVQARANIRLRRMADPAAAASPITARMNQDYVAPRAADTAWAHGLVVAIDGRLTQMQAHLVALGGLAGKPAVSLTQGSAKEGLQELDFLSDNRGANVRDRDQARMLGRKVVETVRARKGSS
jgi:hypothetical protein